MLGSGDRAVSGFLSRKVFVAGIIAADHIGGATSQEAARSPSRAWAGDSGANVLVMGLFGVVFPSGLPDARWTQGFALAQVTALLSASSAVASTALVERGANLPAWQSFFIYVLLATFYVPSEWRARTRDRDRRARAEAFASAATSGEIDDGSTGGGGRSSGSALSDPWRSREDTPVTRSTTRYAALALIDTQANYLIVKAFQYTSLTSVTLLDCAAIPFSMALSRAALGGVYSRRHVLGGATSVLGLAILVLTDAYVRGANDAGSNPALGDFIVLLAAFGYASSNVLQEAALLDGASAVEVLAHVGGFGAVFSGIQCLALELDSLARLNATAGAAGIAELATFAVSLFAMYSLVPEVLRRCGAAAFNVGMLSSDVWAFVARVLFFGGFGDIRAVLAFFASFFVVSAGLVVFLAAGDPLPPERKNQSSRYAALDEDVDAVVADLEDRGGGEREMIDVPPEPGRIRAQHIDVIS
jgi:solute carrier family 35 protein F1/2